MYWFFYTCVLRFKVTPSSMPWASARVSVTLPSLATAPGDITRLWEAAVWDRVVLGGRLVTDRREWLKGSYPAGLCHQQLCAKFRHTKKLCLNEHYPLRHNRPGCHKKAHFSLLHKTFFNISVSIGVVKTFLGKWRVTGSITDKYPLWGYVRRGIRCKTLAVCDNGKLQF